MGRLHRHHSIKNLVLTAIIVISLLLTFKFIADRSEDIEIKDIEIYFPSGEAPPENWRGLTENQTNALSGLGRYLYLDEVPFVKRERKKYTILLWKYGDTLIRRHIKHFSNKSYDPFEVCSVKNCQITYENSSLPTADAVLFHMQRMRGVSDLPPTDFERPAHQRWVWLTDETPFHTFLAGNVFLKDFNGIFNWSMTYRMDSDVPVPYGRTVRRIQPVHIPLDFNKRDDVLVAVLGSNCGGRNNRWKYVDELKKHMEVHVYGGCGKLKCPGHFNADCDKLNQYKFYLSFENSNCPEYITEKLWWNAYSKNAIPIVMGCTRKEYKQLLPPKSYIHVDEFAQPRDLARFIKYINSSQAAYMSYFDWKRYFEVRNEHGYFKSQSYHYCRLCEALNYNSKQPKVYWNLEKFWNKDKCYESWDAPVMDVDGIVYDH